jgi:NAD(P)-dependent dehydrogenase (short-subunit alcohol dehydrogenase family)
MSKVILVTGGSSGIGKAVAHYFAQKGNQVIATSRGISEVTQIPNLHSLSMDVRNEKSVAEVMDYIEKTFGSLDILVNNAGLGLAGPLEFTSNEDAKAVFDTNVFGVLNVCRSAIPLLRNNSGGHIINITSIGGNFGLPFRGIYCASKSAVNALSESLSLELKRFGILVSVIEPGDFKTEINQNRKAPSFVDDKLYPKFEGALQQIKTEVDHGLEPIVIAKQIEKIINSKRPHLYYWVAKPVQRLSVILKRVLPGRLFERMLRKHYGM